MNIIIQLIVSVISGFAYYKLIEPPGNWLTMMSIAVTWIIITSSVFLAALGMIIGRKPIPL